MKTFLYAIWWLASIYCALYVLHDVLVQPENNITDLLRDQPVVQETWIGDGGGVALLYDRVDSNLYDCLREQQRSYLAPQRENTFSTQWMFVHCRLK